MKVLLDHNVPHELRPLFPEEHDVYTAQYLGWADYEDDQPLQ
jgi:predicted nuclease of predicted toxin-antitoxin system